MSESKSPNSRRLASLFEIATNPEVPDDGADERRHIFMNADFTERAEPREGASGWIRIDGDVHKYVYTKGAWRAMPTNGVESWC